MPDSYTPQFLWLLVGPLIGAAVGAVSGIAVMVSVTLSDLSTADSGWDALQEIPLILSAGVTLGGFLGAVAGFFAGLPLIFLVGRHLPRPMARRRAFVVGTLVSPFAVLAMLAVVLGDPSVLPTRLPTLADWGVVVTLAVPSVLAGLLAAWAAGKGPLPKPVS